MANHWVLADQLRSKGLLGEEIYDEATNVVVAVLSTPGGMQYWERDSAATPRGAWLLNHVKSNPDGVPMITELFPWWVAEDSQETTVQGGSSA